MTREEAIILIERAANELREMMKTITMPTSAAEQLQQEIDAHEIAISALRQEKTVTERHDLTNAQKIRAMSDEEMAEFISSIPMCVGKDEDLNCEIDVCKECFLKWLQMPAEEADHA